MSHGCIVIDVDGEPVRIQLAVPESQLTQEDKDAMIELVRYVRKRAEEKKSWKGKKIKIVRSNRS